jgi:uncharacterized protein YjiS (DUF1127 family)
MTRSSAPVAPFSWPAVVGRTARGILRQTAILAKALRHRGEVRHLAEFDDRTLKDIGLLRSDVESALAEPIFRNPSLVLVRSAERRGELQQGSVARRKRPTVPVVGAACACA